MTAVAPLPSFQHLPRWNSGDEREGFGSISAEEVSRGFMPHTAVQRMNSSSSMASHSSSSSSTTSASVAPLPLPQTNGDVPTTNGEQGAWGPRKKAARGLWPSSKAEPVSGLTTARPQVLPTPSSGQSAASTMHNAMHQPSPVLSSQNRLPSQHPQNGSRIDQQHHPTDQPAILVLIPMTGTFERKQIVVPFSPEVLRIGRQTNAKTVPTAVNGFFDSKVLSRQHAEVWSERNGKIWIRDVKSSNGTFVNGNRLSPENRESEPQELREQDTLELGIDIVSEDQKSIVHHKVSAKVEMAGIYPNPPSLLEIDFSHNNPNGGNPMLGEQGNQQASQTRGRGSNQGSIGGNGRIPGPSNMVGNNPNLFGQNRQMNPWMGPITIEQVVKKLAGELKSAKQQFQELDRTGEFFNTLSKLKPGEEPPHSPPKAVAERPQTDDVPLPVQLDPISPFSQPPAPPPQQPLPEKPDVARFISPESPSQPSLKRTETEKPRSAFNSPTRAESSQILSLVEALKIKTHELDSKSDYIKSLELDLAREKKARENAERRAVTLSDQSVALDEQDNDGVITEQVREPPLDSMELMKQDMPNGHVGDIDDRNGLSRSTSMSTITDKEDMDHDIESSSCLASRLQAQLDLQNKEMNEMKILMESYRQRTTEAEEGRRSLAEMVENIRAGRDPESVFPIANGMDSAVVNDNDPKSSTGSTQPLRLRNSNRTSSSSQSSHPQPNGSATMGHIHREIEKTVSNVLQQHQQWGSSGESGRLVQSAPYVSMVSVVLIGVGLMTWLNGWQPNGDK